MNELITVVVPVYNVENYLRQCLDSVLNQTYQHLEILLIDDCSTDGSLQICREYEAKDGRVRVIASPQNLGVSHSRNIALSNAKGSYISFIDSDDWIDEDYVKVMYEQLVLNDADISMVDYCRYSDDDGKFYLYPYEEDVIELTDDAYFSGLFEAAKDTYVIACAKLFKLSLFNDRVPIRFPHGKVGEDKFVTHLLIMKSRKTMFIRKAYYCWRVRMGSISHNTSVQSGLSDFEGSKQRLLDCVLSGQSVPEALDYYYRHLYLKKAFLEEKGATQTDFYREVLTSIALMEKNF